MTVLLRPWRRSDVAAYHRNMNNEQVSAYLSDGVPYPFPPEQAARYIEDALACDVNQQYHRAIEAGGELAGGLVVRRQADVYVNTGVIGYSLGEPFWGRGIATRAVSLACTEVFDLLNLTRIQAEVYEHNTVSRRLLEKLGFTLEAVRPRHVIKRGVVMDACLYGLLREEWKHE